MTEAEYKHLVKIARTLEISIQQYDYAKVPIHAELVIEKCIEDIKGILNQEPPASRTPEQEREFAKFIDEEIAPEI
jgi:hypothetical protein